jgi:hypothetical protein
MEFKLAPSALLTFFKTKVLLTGANSAPVLLLMTEEFLIPDIL